jgi:Tfp pilus assembly protein PilO
VPQDDTGSSLQKFVMTALWAIVLLLAGWTYQDSQRTRHQLETELLELRLTTSINQQKVAVLEEALRNAKEALMRIESGVLELQRLERRPR